LTPTHDIIDVGTDGEESCDYPVFAQKVCDLIRSGKADRGILICGTGIGMSIVSNRYSGIRAALCHDEFTAERARLHNDAQILALGAQVVDQMSALKIARIFMNTAFHHDDPSNQRHVRRIQLIEN